MIKKITKITSVLLAIVVLFSTLSFTVEKHFCGDFLVDVSYFGNAENCAELSVTDSCTTDTTTFVKKKCCKDEVLQIDGQDQLQKTTDYYTSSLSPFIVSDVHFYEYGNQNLRLLIPELTHYHSPFIIQNLQVQYEVFLI